LKDGAFKACFGIGGVVAVYGIYMGLGPGGDGLIVGSVIAVVAGLAGYTIGAKAA